MFSCESNLQLAYDCRVRREECRGLLKHVLKPYDNRSDRQFDIVEIVCDFFMMRAGRATKIACDNSKQKLYRVNRPLESQHGARQCRPSRFSHLIGQFKRKPPESCQKDVTN